MIKLKEILLEASKGRSKSITLEDAKRMLQTKCKSFSESATPIYRGIHDFEQDYGLVRPSKFQRRSANTKNYYTYLVDNSKLWSQFPDRSKSIICTTNKSYTWGYGDTYRIIPFDGAKMGVAPEGDMWGSFKFIKERYGMFLGKFNRFLNDLVEVSSMYKRSLSDKSFNEFKSGIDWLSNNKKKMVAAVEFDINYKGDIFDKGSLKFIRDYQKYNGNLYEFIEELFDPKKNGFTIQKYSGSFRTGEDNEVWTSSDSLLVADEALDELIKSI